MRLPCLLRDIRGERKLAEIASTAGVNPGELSKIETGQQLPKDKWIPALEAAYGVSVAEWYEWHGPYLLAESDEKAAA